VAPEAELTETVIRPVTAKIPARVFIPEGYLMNKEEDNTIVHSLQLNFGVFSGTQIG
jgi:hypothetical protein